MQRLDPVGSVVFFWTYIFGVAIVCINVLLAILIEAYTDVVKPDDPEVPFNSVGEQLSMAFRMMVGMRHRRGALEKELHDSHLLDILRSFARDHIYRVTEEDIAARL